MFACLSGVFPPLLSLKYITYSFFCLSALSLFPPCCRVSSVPPRSSSTAPQARGHPCSSLLPSFLPAFPPLVFRCLLSVVCSVAAVCLLPCPRGLFRVSVVCAPLKLPGGLLCVLSCVLLLSSLVRHQAQDGVTVWADAPRIYPRPFVLLPMCCRWLFCCPFRVLSCGFLPCVRVCVLLPCVVRRQ